MSEYPPDQIDPETVVIYLEVPGSKVVLFQGHFELYEGVGTVRTLDIRSSLVCVITTPSMYNDCMSVLESIQPDINWRLAPIPAPELRERYLGYFKREFRGLAPVTFEPGTEG